MFKSYFKTDWRNIVRNKLFSFINLIGLSVGIAAVLLIGIYIQNELSYDSFQKNKDSVFRVGYEFFNKGKSMGNGPDFTPPFGPEAKNEFPEIQSFCRISENHEAFLVKGENNIKSTGICFADSTFFKLFSLKLLSGNAETVTAVSTIPHDGIPNNGFIPEGDTKAMIIHQLDGDEDLLKTFRFKMLSGNFFSKDKPTDADGYIINETLAKTLGWQNPIGKTIESNGVHRVIGVVQDFIFASLHQNIGPLIITNHPWLNRFDYLAIRYKSNIPAPLLKQIKNIWQNMDAAAPFDYWFLDESYNNLYKNEDRFQQIFFYFSLLSILLSLGGIFGLVTLTIQQRTKEMGIRKVLGAGIIDILKLTTRSYLILILMASVLAIPFAYYYMNKWLQNFAFRIQLSWWMFIIAGIVTLSIALITVSIQTYKAAKGNPVKSLRTE